MAEHQQIVHDIQTILSSDNDPDTAALEELENELISGVVEANQRLRDCETLLHKGLRAEAIQQCEIEPNLLDVVALLDFPEREVWDDYVRQFGLPAPPELLLDIAADLNEAYSDGQSVDGLLRLNRLHALARSPLPVRIGILRRIAERDQANPIWEDDVRTYERVRQNQLREEVAVAIKQTDTARLASLEQELRDPNWLEMPSKSVISKVTKAHTQLRAREAYAELQQLEALLTAAFGEFDIAQARTLHQRWDALLPIADLANDDPLWELVRPVFDWLAQENKKEGQEIEYSAAVEKLEQALNADANKEELERLYYQAVKNDRELPDMLHRRLAERLESLHVASSRRNKLIIGAVVMVVMLIGALTTLLIMNKLNAQKLAAHATNLQEQIAAGTKSGDYSAASKYSDNLVAENPAAAADPQIQQLQEELDGLIKKEQGRKNEFKNLLTGAEEAGTDDPSFPSIDSATDQLDQAQDLAKSEDEQRQVKALRNRIRNHRDKLQKEVDDAFEKEYLVLKNQVAEVDAEDLDGIRELLEKCNELKARPRVSDELRSLLGPLSNTLNNKMSGTLRTQQELKDLRKITSAVGSRERFKRALEEYAKKNPTSARSQEFLKIVNQEAGVWSQLEQWNAFINRWSLLDLRQLDPAEAKQLAAEAQKMIDEHGRFPAADKLKGYVEYLNVVTQRVDDSGQKLQLNLNKDVLSIDTVAGLFMVRTGENGGTRYYSKEEPEKKRLPYPSVKVKFLKNTDFDTGDEHVRNENILNDRDGRSWWDFRAPQSRFAKYSMDLLPKIGSEIDWESAFLDILIHLFDEQHMEPILKLQLMDEVLLVAGQGSSFLKTSFESHVNIYATANLDSTVNWLAPVNADARLVRKKANDLLKRMAHPRTFQQPLQQYLKGLNRPVLGLQLDWFGWMYRDATYKWKCQTKDSAPKNKTCDLYVVFADSGSAPVQIEKVGECRNGKVSLTAASFLEGRPVFAPDE